MPAYLPLTVGAVRAVEHATIDLDNALVERIVSVDARFAARSRGSRAVTERDFAIAAAQAAGMTNPFAPSPADVLPEHYDSILDSLEHIRSAARAHL